MVDDSSFLRAISADLLNDAPRLTYADFLDDRGDADRADLIRVQCALNSLPPNDAGVPALRRRERMLIEENWREWIKPVCQALGEPLPIVPRTATTGLGGPVARIANIGAEPYVLNWKQSSQAWTVQPRPAEEDRSTCLHAVRFDRGFVARVAVTRGRAVGGIYFGRLFERTPVDSLCMVYHEAEHIAQVLHAVRDYRPKRVELLLYSAQTPEKWIDEPALEEVNELFLNYRVGGGDLIAKLTESSALRSLRKFVVRSTTIPSHALEQFLASSVARPLTALFFDQCNLDQEHVRMFIESPIAGRIERLVINNNSLSAMSRRALQRNFGDRLSIETRTPRWPELIEEP